MIFGCSGGLIERRLARRQSPLRLLHPRHSDHVRARAWFDRQISLESIKVCRIVQMGALRLLTSPVVMGDDLQSPTQAWEGYWRAMDDERFRFVGEPEGLESFWQELTKDHRGLIKVDTDTYLAAFALAGGHTLATFDGGFARFSGLRTEIL